MRKAVANDVDLASANRAIPVRHTRMYRSALTYQSAASPLRTIPAGISHLVKRRQTLSQNVFAPTL